MKKSLLFIIPGIIIGIIAGLMVFKNISNKVPSNPPELIGNTAGNLNSGGLFCESNGIIFFANPYDKNRLYSMTADCNDIRCVSDDSVRYINVAGDYVYYIRDNGSFNESASDFRGDMYGLVRCKFDGSSLRTLVSGYCTDLSVTGDTLVYSSNRNSNPVTCTIDIRGGESSIINDYSISTASVFNGKLFYSDGSRSHYIYNMNVSDGLSSLYLTGNTYMSVYSEDTLYYIDLDNNSALTRIDLSSKQKTIVTTDPCTLYNVHGDTVFYYTESEAGRGLYRIGTDGSDRTYIMAGGISTISCTSKYTFFQLKDSDKLYRVSTFGRPTVQSLFIQPQE